MIPLIEEPSNMFDRIVNFFVVNQDPRTMNWFLSGSPVPLATILVSYLYFCLYAGPKYMKNRKPFELKNVLIVYNAIQVVFSCILVHEGLEGGWRKHYNFTCELVDYSDNPIAMRMLGAVWFYYMCKLIELLDTVFFVLRKKQNQVTFLHVYHHTMMPFAGFIGTKYVGGGHTTLLGLINSFIHVIMYAYYMLAAMGPHMQKYLWWKRYLTVMQMIQFGVVFIHTIQVQFYPSCKYPKGIAALLSLNAALFFYMFASFYYYAYVKPAKAKAEMNGDTSKQLNGKIVNGLSNGYSNGTCLPNGHSIWFGHKPYSNGIANGNIANGKTKVHEKAL